MTARPILCTSSPCTSSPGLPRWWVCVWLLLAVGVLLQACDAGDSSGSWVTAGVAPQPRPQPVTQQEQPPEPVLWKPLAGDGLHDPSNPALPLLQEPKEALSVLPRANEGNNVDWVAALEEGYIDPRTNIYPDTEIKVLDQDILMEDTAGMPMVLFPHRQHTEWLDCKNCHDRIFKAERGANNVNMFEILQGQYCGQCHGAVSFPLTQCQRCHSVDRPGSLRAREAAG